jgi:excisionase family DNA binding protein
MTEYLTVTETANRLQISVATVYRLLAAGRLRSVKIGRSRRFPTGTVDAFVASDVHGLEP